MRNNRISGVYSRGIVNQSAEDSHDGNWFISYGDMVTLLLSFFVIFFSIDQKTITENKLENSLVSSFSNPLIKNLQDTKTNELVEIPNLELVKVGDGEMVVIFKNLSFFDSGEFYLRTEGRKEIEKFYNSYIPYASKYKIVVQSYTDPRKVSEVHKHKFKDNLELSVLRSLSVIRVLSELGVPNRRLEISGRGVIDERMRKVLDIDTLSTENLDRLYASSRTISILLVRNEDKK